jgi:hypothetical protein
MRPERLIFGPARGAVALGDRVGRAASEVATEAAGRAALAGLDALLRWRYTDEAVERVADRVFEDADRVVNRVFEDTRLLDSVVERLLESEELWVLVDEIARSPAVTEAITQQSVGFADQVAGQVRLRSQRADAGLERAARRLLRRGSPPPTEPAGPDAR